uniref:Uncharacterized protein n=1 Tax=Glossina austeni TaxID=7395 RepID=A0A1A9UP69_GLOAU
MIEKYAMRSYRIDINKQKGNRKAPKLTKSFDSLRQPTVGLAGRLVGWLVDSMVRWLVSWLLSCLSNVIIIMIITIIIIVIVSSIRIFHIPIVCVSFIRLAIAKHGDRKPYSSIRKWDEFKILISKSSLKSVKPQKLFVKFVFICTNTCTNELIYATSVISAAKGSIVRVFAYHRKSLWRVNATIPERNKALIIFSHTFEMTSKNFYHNAIENLHVCAQNNNKLGKLSDTPIETYRKATVSLEPKRDGWRAVANNSR